MPTAMEYAINTIVGLCEENTKLRMKIGGEIIPTPTETSLEDTASFITTADWEKLKASADLIAEAKEKQIKKMVDDMSAKDKRIAELEKELADEKAKIVFQNSKGTFGSPYMEEPLNINGVLNQ